MRKRIVSIILSLSIVASLFAGVGFNASAAVTDNSGSLITKTDKTGNTVYIRNQSVTNLLKEATTNWDIHPTKSLIRNKTPQKIDYYINESFKTNANSYFNGVSDVTFGKLAEDGVSSATSNLTRTDTFSGDTQIVNTIRLKNGMFVLYENGSSTPTKLVNSESDQYIQFNYELDAPASIESFFFGSDRTSSGAWQPGHWKFYVADTEDELFVEGNCVAEMDMVTDGTAYRIAKTELSTAKTGKWVGVRLICAYRTTPTTAKGSTYIRIDHLTVQGTYVNSVTMPATTPSAIAKDINGNTIEGITPTATAGYVGNSDKADNYGAAGAQLSTEVNVTIGTDYYEFEGWYLGETKVADTATAEYAITGNEENLDFVAKYSKTYKAFSNYTVAGENKANLSGTGEDASKSLIVNKIPSSAQVFNAIDIEGKLNATNGVLEYSLENESEVAWLTHPTDFTTDARIFPSATMSAYSYNMFANWTKRESGGTITEIIDDEDLQWAQINYTLDGKASINTVVFGAMATSYSVQMPSHYKLIFSDTEDGLRDHTKAKAVIELDATKDATLKTSRHTVTLTTPVEAKYVGIRFICMFNETSVNSTRVYQHMYTNRIKHFGVYGTYTELADANVTYAVEGGAPESVVTKADPAYVGNIDNNNKYALGTVTLTAEQQYIDAVNEVTYNFVEWQKGGETYSVDNAITYDLTGEDAQFTAVYEQGEMLYILDFVDATGEIIDSLELEKNATPTAQQMAAINEKVKAVYGYEIVTNQYGIDWGEDVYTTPASANKTYYARYRNLGYQTAVTVTKVDGTKAYNNQNVSFDTAITVTDDAAAAWEMDGAVVATGTELKLYAAGATMNVTATAEEKPADELAFVGKSMENGNFSVFVHVNPTKDVKAYGVIFSSDSYKKTYDVQDDDIKSTMFVLDDTSAFDTTGNRKPNLIDNRVTVTNAANVDFTTSLTDVATNLDGTYKTRHARAYVIYSDDSVVYSDVIISNK